MKIHDISLYELAGETLLGVHYSDQPKLTELTTSSWNNAGGMPGAERERMERYPDWFVKNRIYFYRAGSNFHKEAGVGNNTYYAELHNIYDWDADPKNFHAEAIKIAKQEYSDNQHHLMKMVGIDHPDINPDHYDSALAQTIEESLIKKAGYNGFYSQESNENIVYFQNVKVSRTMSSAKLV